MDEHSSILGREINITRFLGYRRSLKLNLGEVWWKI